MQTLRPITNSFTRGARKDRGARFGALPLIYVIQFIELNQVEEDYTMVVTVENGATYDRIYPVQLARATPFGLY